MSQATAAGSANPIPLNTMQQIVVGETQTNASNLTTTLQVATGGVIDQIFLDFGSATEAQIRAEITGNIRLTFDGKQIVNCKASRLLDFFKCLGSLAGGNGALVAGCIPLNIAPLVYRDPASKLFLGLGTADVQNIQIAIDCGTIVNVANVTARIVKRPLNQVLGTYGSFIDYPREYNAAGTDYLTTLPRTVNTAYLAVMINAGSAGVISNSEIMIGNIPVRQKVPKTVNDWLNRDYGFSTDAADAAGDGQYFVHMLSRTDITSYMGMKNVTDLSVNTTFSTASGGAYTVTPLVLTQFAGA